LIGLFYAVEDWRGERAWKNCKRALEAQGVNLDWTNYIPAPVPEEQNVFGVPEMQQWFGDSADLPGLAWQATELSKKLAYPGYAEGSRKSRLIVAELKICLPGVSLPTNSGAAVLQSGDPQTRAEMGRLMREALGPVVMDPAAVNFLLRPPEEIRPARIFLRCQIAPTTNALLEYLPKPIVINSDPDSEEIQVKPNAFRKFPWVLTG
jgi:hypothetical protein